MSSNLIQLKTFLGKYFSELNYSAVQEKYKKTGLETIFEQRFLIQGNKVQMVVDSSLNGLTAIVAGNEIYVSKTLYDHPNVVITNSLERDQATNPRSLYTAETFSTVAYLICQNHTMFQIVGEIDEPIYVKYRTDYETFYNSVIVFDISNDIEVEIVEEIESVSALNSVTNYILHPNSDLKLSTFYQNHLSGISFVYRNIIAREGSSYNHLVFGKGSSNVIDENKLIAYEGSSSEFFGVINSGKKNFHSILYVHPQHENYSVTVDYKDILYGKSNISFFPVILGQHIPDATSISITNISLEEIPEDNVEFEINKYISDIMGRAILGRMVGVERFYSNKTKFLHFP
jgi:hypothetical protein